MNSVQSKISVLEIAVFGMLGALMYASKELMALLPNIHIVGALVVAETVVFRKKALYPIYVYVLLMGLFSGFTTWWIPHLYLWLILWGAVMLVPKNISLKWQPVVYATVCSLHGFLYGILYAPFQALAYHLNFQGMIIWIANGFLFDVTHGISNFIGTLILFLPIVKVLQLTQRNKLI